MVVFGAGLAQTVRMSKTMLDSINPFSVMRKALLTLVVMASVVSLYAQQGDTITYKSKKKLDWSDFRMEPKGPESGKRAELNVTIVTETKKVDLWWGVITVESYAGVRRDSSWVVKAHADSALLGYMQLTYDLANDIARKSAVEINSKKINAGNQRKIGKIITAHLVELKSTLDQMDRETNYGRYADKVQEWSGKVYKK